MKTKFLILALALFSYTFVNGQDFYKDLEQQSRTYTEELTNVLNLTQSQEELVFRQNIVFFEYKKRFDKMENQTEQHETFLNQAKKEYKENMNKLLTEEQREEFESWLKDSKFLD